MSNSYEDILIWTITKTEKQIDAVVRHIKGVGCDRRFLLDGDLRQSQLYQRHTAPIDAVTGATNKRVELLKQDWLEVYPPPRDSD